jgi:hypothetical protein
MTGDATISPDVAEKALRLFDEHRVILRTPWAADVVGDAGVYRVIATTSGLRCDCPSKVRCSHTYAASIAFAEREQG